MSDLDTVIDSLLSRAGVNDVQADDDGVYSLFVDNDLPLFLKQSSDGRDLFLYGGLAAITNELVAQNARTLLEANGNGLERHGFFLSIGPDTDLMFLTVRLRLSGYDEDELFAILDRFIHEASHWASEFANHNLGENPSARAQSPAPSEDDDARRYHPKPSDLV